MGISHKVTVETMWGLKIEKPVEAMREYLTIVRTSLRDGGCSFDVMPKPSVPITAVRMQHRLSACAIH